MKFSTSLLALGLIILPQISTAAAAPAKSHEAPKAIPQPGNENEDFSRAITGQKKTLTSNITIQGFDVPKNYRIGTFAHEASLQGQSCMNLNIQPEDKDHVVYTDNLNKYLGQKIDVTINEPKAKNNKFSGYVTEISFDSASGEYSIASCGKLDLTRYGSRDKLYTNKSEVDAVKDLLAERGIDAKFDLKKTYTPDEFLTKLNETDENFINRMLEQNGIFYFVKNLNGKDTYVFLDDIEGLNKYNKEVDYKDLTLAETDSCCGDLKPSVSLDSKLVEENYRLEDYDEINDKYIGSSANDKASKFQHTEFQISNYNPALLKEGAEIKLKALNSTANSLTITSNNLDIAIGDKINIASRKYYVISSSLNYSCLDYDDKCHTTNSLSLIPVNTPYANSIITAMPMMNSSLVGFIADATKDDKGRLGLRLGWMHDEPENVMYRALLSETAKKAEFKKGDRVLVNFINGFPDKPVIADKF